MLGPVLLAAVLCYVGAAATAAAPFVRPVQTPLRTVLSLLGAGVALHLVALVGFTLATGELPLFGFGPALSSAAFLLAATLLVAELIASEATLTLVGAPFAALLSLLALAAGLTPGELRQGIGGPWFLSHVAASFVGFAAWGTAAAAGTMYLVQRRELKQRRLGSVLRLFPPLATLDRVNHHASVLAWLALTVGVVLAATYSASHGSAPPPKIVWAVAAWLAASVVTLGRLLAGWQARRAALLSSSTFLAVLLLYVALRTVGASAGRFL